MRNLAIIALLFLGYGDPPDTTDSVKVEQTVQTRSLEVEQDMDTIKLMIKELKDAINKANGDSIPADRVRENLLR